MKRMEKDRWRDRLAASERMPRRVLVGMRGHGKCNA